MYLIQILGNKGHSLSWLPTGISNPYIRVTLISCNTGDGENVRSSSSKVLNLPSNSRCKLAGIAEKNLKDCLLKLVVLEFDRFSRSEFVAEVLVPLGDLGDLREGVRICQELMLQQKVMVRQGSSRRKLVKLKAFFTFDENCLVSNILCNQYVVRHRTVHRKLKKTFFLILLDCECTNSLKYFPMCMKMTMATIHGD